MYGIDISKHQKALDLNRGDYDFCIVKATEGIGYRDPMFLDNMKTLSILKKLKGAYHFGRPDLHGTVEKIRDEADYFVEQCHVAGILGRAILVLDWETEPVDREDLITAWVDRVIQLTRITPFIYGSRSKLTRWKNWEVMRRCPIWMAIWPNKKNYTAGSDPQLPLPKSDFDWKIWQYSATGRFPGFSGDVDLDYTPLTTAEWMGYCELPKVETTTQEEIIISDMQWAIDNGLFKGYSDGLYRPKNPMTRENTAVVLHRFYKMLEKQRENRQSNDAWKT